MRLVDATLEPRGKGAVRPIAGAGDGAVPDRVVMNAIEMRAEIALVRDGAFPIAPRPDRPLALGGTRSGAVAIVRRGNRPRERRFDEADAGRIVTVALGQRPEEMQMIRQDDLGLDDERSLRIDVRDRRLPLGHCPRVVEEPSPLVRDDGEEIRAAFDPQTPIAHRGIPLSACTPALSPETRVWYAKQMELHSTQKKSCVPGSRA